MIISPCSFDVVKSAFLIFLYQKLCLYLHILKFKHTRYMTLLLNVFIIYSIFSTAIFSTIWGKKVFLDVIIKASLFLFSILGIFIELKLNNLI